MFNDLGKSVLQIIQMLKNACECHCESNECFANETRMQNMGIQFAKYSLRVFFIALYLQGPVQSAYLPSNLD